MFPEHFYSNYRVTRGGKEMVTIAETRLRDTKYKRMLLSRMLFNPKMKRRKKVVKICPADGTQKWNTRQKNHAIVGQTVRLFTPGFTS